MMMTETYHHSPSILAASLGIQVDDEAIMDQRKELQREREERMARKLRKDMEKMKKSQADVVKVGLMVIPDRTGEQQVMREHQWWEEEMARRETMRLEQEAKEAQFQAQMTELANKEAQLEELKGSWQAKAEEIRLEEAELQRIQKDFEGRIQAHLDSSKSQSSGSAPAPHTRSRMQEEADRRALKKVMKQNTGDAEQQARSKLIIQIEEKTLLEREIVRLQKEVGLLKQRIAAQEKSTLQNMDAEKRRRSESIEGRQEYTLEELYAPKKAAPRPVIARSHNTRMEQAKAEREAKRAAMRTQNNTDISSSSSSSSKKPGDAKP